MIRILVVITTVCQYVTRKTSPNLHPIVLVLNRAMSPGQQECIILGIGRHLKHTW
jgi:hypothetical protein